MAGSSATTAMCGNGRRESDELCDGDCPTTCPALAGCLSAMLVGSAATCDAQCKSTEITACKSGDGCCAEGCKYPEDTDCSKSCGDGVVDSPEVCEPSSADQPCPTSCDDGDPCTEDIKTGTPDKCNVVCTHMPITASKSGDSCCPPGANANNDRDCKPECGNEIKEDGELCDGDCLTECIDSDPCTDDVLVGSPSQCNVVCKHNPKSRGPRPNCDTDNDPCTSGIAIESPDKCGYECDITRHDRGPQISCPERDADPCTTNTARPSTNSCQWVCENETRLRTRQICSTGGDPCKKVVTKPSTTSCVTECVVEEMPHTGETDPTKCPDDGNACTTASIRKVSSCKSECQYDKHGAGVKNACGGCGALAHPIGSGCGTGAGCEKSSIWLCNPPDNVLCLKDPNFTPPAGVTCP